MHALRSISQRTLLSGVAAIATVLAVTAVATGATASAPPRTEASLTDASAEAAGVFIAVSPLRVLDTRPAPEGPIGVSTPAPLGHQATMNLRLAGDGFAIPATATSAFLNVTIDDDATVQSFLTVWPTGEPRPVTSANNAEPTLVASNSILAKIGDNGSISIFNQQGAINVVVDVVGYMVPLETANGPGAQLLSGAVAPTSADGSDGDYYIDRSTNILYGPKTGGAWPTPGIALGGVQGAAGGYNTAVATPVIDAVAANVPIAFNVASPADGSVVRTNATTFTVSQSGLFTVDYHLAVTTSALGSITVAVNGVLEGPASTLTGAAATVADTVLVDAVAGDIVQLMYTPTVLGTGIVLGSSTIVVEQTTAN